MKKNTITWIFGFMVFPFYAIQVSAQEKETIENIEVRKHTVMERYEPTLVLSVKERIRLKEERLAIIEKRREILDTLNISERRRQRLLKELFKKPFSDKLNKTIASVEFANDDEAED